MPVANLISVLGLVALLGLAWALSYHRREVKLRPVVWGLGLQFLFALIILREDVLSFIGMAVFGGLLIVYMTLRFEAGSSNWPRVGVFLAGAFAAAAVLYYLDSSVSASAFWLVLVALVANSRFRLVPKLQLPLQVLVISIVVAWLTSQGMHGQRIFQAASIRVTGFLNLSDYGARFLFGNLASPQHWATGDGSPWPGFGVQFAFRVLPTIVFFGGFMSVLYYLGIMSRLIETLARFMRWTLGTSGAETMSCSANIFVGQTEAPLLVKPFLAGMTRSELLTVMVGGFATIAGGVLAGYIAFGVPAGHLIAASVMSAPAALVVGKIIYPEREKSETSGDISLPEIDSGDNLIEAATNGISDGLRLAVNVGAMLLGFIALIAVVDVVLSFLDGLIDGRLLDGSYVQYGAQSLSPVTGEYEGFFPGSLQKLFGVLLSPLAWLMGVPWADASKVGNLLGVKLSLNEFVAFGTLGSYIQAGELSDRAVIISTYALCGFANFSSIGIQIGGISAVAPQRKATLAKLGLKAMCGGAIASWLTATIAGMLIPA
ncbi:MAG: nucleoside transporter C-terminal domain-containing protein [Acidobacteriota bacterium]|nr:nucleoside transporter C-terminal domain-containing protein [Acidobacteriota bacterium]